MTKTKAQNLQKQLAARIKIARGKIAAAANEIEAARWEGRILGYSEACKLIADLAGSK